MWQEKNKKCVKFTLVCFVVTPLLLIPVILLRTFTLSVRSDSVRPCRSSDADFIPATDAVVSRFRQAIQFKTVSTERHNYNRSGLQKFGDFIRKAFPLLHSSGIVSHDVVGNYSLLYRIKGSNSSLTPYMLMGHLDVVPAEPSRWEVDPFSGSIKDGYIYGRGTIDDKHAVMSILETMEYLLSKEFKPKRSFYIAFGHDEEVNGVDGARVMSELLYEKGLRKLEFIVDEGLTVTNNIFPGTDVPVALIGTSEKGYINVELKVKGEVGHSSMPMKDTAITILGKAISKLEGSSHPSMFGKGPEKAMFEHMASKMRLSHRIVMSNLWLFKPLVSWALSQKPVTNAIVRTVTSVTMIQGGVKINVLPPEATAKVNHRVHPAQTVKEVVDYDRELINDDRVEVKVVGSMEPLPMSPYGDEDFGYQTLKNSIQQIWTNAAVAPGVTIGNTDTKHYTRFTSNIYRFSPTFMFPPDLKRYHGDNERISIKNYEQAINFYYHLIINADEEGLMPYHKHGEEL